MSDTAATTPAVPSLVGLGPARPPRSEGARILIETFGPIATRFALAWMLLIGFFAAFAPLIANSHPFAIKIAGKGWSSPMLKHLTGGDAAALVLVVVAMVLAFLSRLTWQQRVLIFLAAAAVVIPLALWLVRPPELIVYSAYRNSAREGAVEAVYNTIIPYSPNDRLRDVAFDADNAHPWAPSSQHLLGTDQNGSDVLSRMIHACRIAILVGFVSTSIAVVLGVIVGGVMGYFSGVVDLLGMRALEVFSAIPTLFLILILIAAYGQNQGTLYLIMLVIGVTGFPGYAVFIRAEFLKLRQQEFVQAAVAAGLPLRSILLRHMLPNGVTPVLVSASFGIAGAINVENVLSFLKIGLIEEPSWGALLNQASAGGTQFKWWLAMFPGVALTLTMFAFILIGESMRDVIDPYTNRKS